MGLVDEHARAHAARPRLLAGGGRARPAEAAAAHGEAGVTRRGFLAGAGLVAAVLVAGGIAWRVAPWRDWLGSAGDKLGVDIPGALRITRRDFTLDSRYVDEPVGYSIAWPPGYGAGRSAPRVLRAAGSRRRSPPMGFADFVAAAVRKDQSPPYAVVGVDGGVSYWHRRKTGEDRLSMLLDELVPLCARRYHLGGGGRGRAIIGWSMGGYGALVAAETEPEPLRRRGRRRTGGVDQLRRHDARAAGRVRRRGRLRKVRRDRARGPARRRAPCASTAASRTRSTAT